MFVFSIEQEVAASYSNAFSGCSGLSNILNGLQSRPVPAGKAPKAIKRPPKRPLKAAGKAKPKAKAKAQAAVPAENVQAAPAQADEAAVLGAEAVGAAKTVTRNCFCSKAYRVAKRLAQAGGKSPAEQLEAAKTAYRDAGIKWDQEHA